MDGLEPFVKRRKEFGEAEGPPGPNERERVSPSRWDSWSGGLQEFLEGKTRPATAGLVTT